MAIRKICDICGPAAAVLAVAEMEFKTDQTTLLKKDLCERHFEYVKRFMNSLVADEIDVEKEPHKKLKPAK